MMRYTYDYKTQAYKVDDSLGADLGTVIDGFIHYKQVKNFEAGQNPGRRGAFIKTHGGAWGTFRISYDDLDPDDPGAALIRKGIFGKEASYSAWIRFGSDINEDKPDRHSTIGASIKLFNVPGLNVLDWNASTDAASQTTTVDFVFQNYQVFFASDAAQMAKYKAAALQGPAALQAFRNRPENAVLNKIINDMIAQDPSSALAETYWSCVPFILGVPAGGFAHYCKYILTPTPGQQLSPAVDKNDPDFIRKDLISNIGKSAYSFDFYIHLRTSPSQSIENASDNWEAEGATGEGGEPFRTTDVKHLYKIGVLELPQQDISQRGQDAYVEQLAFNPWRTLPDNVPYGEIALARRISYEIAAKNRRNLNGQTVGEPVQPRPGAFDTAQYGQPELDTPWNSVSGVPLHNEDDKEDGGQGIVRVAIHPGIGVARVGNSQLGEGQDWLGDGEAAGDHVDCYVGPETDAPPPADISRVRDASGRIKRQAARFRLYGFNAAGEVVREILPDDPDVKITWSVTLANRKAQWFRFDHSWDKSFFKGKDSAASTVRNPEVTDRASLAITPPAASISGKAARSAAMTGSFQGTEVYLGELRTDSQGRLLVLGGMGAAASIAPEGHPDATLVNGNSGGFNNASGWYDDISDGPVHAEVVIGGQTLQADPAWVIVAPPNYAPDLVGFRTLYDLLEEIYIEAGMLPMPEQVSFSRHILPSLQRLSALSWVNKGFHDLFGPGKKWDFTNADLIAQLRQPPAGGADPGKDRRKEILDQFQSPYADGCSPTAWPLLYGDTFGEDMPGGSGPPFLNKNQPDDMCALSSVRYGWFKRWADGDFVDDVAPPAYASLDDCPLRDQPALLDKAALHFCLADAFHPGCEVTWPMRHLAVYRAPWRIREAADEVHAPAPDETLDYIAAHTPGGALGAQPPGGLTRWMALPWHGDTARCRSGYDSGYYDPDDGSAYGTYTPAYWPARVPNQVLTMADYQTVMDAGKTDDARIAAFAQRRNWWRNLSDRPDSRDPDAEDAQEKFMVAHYDKMGMLVRKPGPSGLTGVPAAIYVEHLP